MEIGTEKKTVSKNIKEVYEFVIDLKKLSRLIKDEVTDKLDHKNLNLDVDFMKPQHKKYIITYTVI